MDQQQTDEPQDLDELEEGEIADDSNDGCSITNDDNDNDCANAFGDDLNDSSSNRLEQAPNDGVGGGTGGQKRRRKVVRKVKRKIKVKKKVVRKKGGSAGGGVGPNATDTSNLSNQSSNVGVTAPMLPTTQTISTSLTGLNLNQPLLPQNQQQQQQQPQTQNNPQQLDSLWEQQILMLQELQKQQQQQADQKHTQLLRAAATDEDLRIFPPTFVRPFAQQNLQQPLLPLQPIATIPNTTSSPASLPASTAILQSQYNPTYTTTPLSTLPPVNSNFNYQQTNAPNSLVHHQTPSSPDDENGTPSYEAISKMLTLLRNSNNVSDPSEITDNELQQSSNNNNNDNSSNKDLSSSAIEAQSEQTLDYAKRGNIEYALVPILVAGIDYTKYKLLSQYEPKFKNDPRLVRE